MTTEQERHAKTPKDLNPAISVLIEALDRASARRAHQLGYSFELSRYDPPACWRCQPPWPNLDLVAGTSLDMGTELDALAAMTASALSSGCTSPSRLRSRG